MNLDQAVQTLHPVEIDGLLSNRFSPYQFSSRTIEPEKLRRLFEAARWAPSSYNDQPWSFILATRENPADYLRLLSGLAEPNQRWAQQAPILVLAVAKLNSDRTGKTNRHAWYDVGQAVANLTVQATAMGLVVHQMGGFDSTRVRELFQIPAGYDPVTAIAIGYPVEADAAVGSRAPRSRRALEGFVFSGAWGQTSPLVQDAERRNA